MKTILILGAQGQLGIELQSVFHDAGRIIAHSRAECDLSQPDSVRSAVRTARPHVIANAAAYTAVDRAESEPDLAMRINGEGPGILAEEAKKLGALLVHYSTDYVFDGTRPEPYIETDSTHPLNVYGSTKLAGERSIEQVGGAYLIFRTSWVFSPHGKNFLLTMLRLGQERDHLNIVNDQHGAPTSALAIATATREVLNSIGQGQPTDHSGIYHMTCSGHTTWCGFAQAIFAGARANKPRPSITGIPSTQYPTPAARPANSVLSNEKLKSTFGVALPSWQSALETSLRSLHPKREPSQK